MEKTITYIIAMIIIVSLGTLAFWGLGKLIIWAFGFNFNWTIWHGLCLYLIHIVLKSIFGGGK